MPPSGRRPQDEPLAPFVSVSDVGLDLRGHRAGEDGEHRCSTSATARSMQAMRVVAIGPNVMSVPATV